MRFCQDSGIVADFVIRNPTQIAFVRVKRTMRMRFSPADIEAGSFEPVAALRSILSAAEGVQCELWTYSKNGTWRFFRVGRQDLVEIDREGSPMSTPGHGRNYSGKKSGTTTLSRKA